MAAVVLLVAVGGIIMALGGGGDEPVSTITPSAPTTPTAEPTTEPTDGADDRAVERAVHDQPTDKPTQAPAGKAIDLGNGVKLTPAAGWQVRSEQKGAAQLANGRDIFVGIVAKLPADSNAGQTCDAYHRDIAKEYTNGKFADPKKADLGTKKLSGATCQAQVTVANGGNAIKVTIFSLVSIRTDGLTVVGTAVLHRGLRHRAARQGLQRDGELHAEGPGGRRLADTVASGRRDRTSRPRAGRSLSVVRSYARQHASDRRPVAHGGPAQGGQRLRAVR